MSRIGIALLLLLGLSVDASAKCGPPDMHRLTWTRTIVAKTLPTGIEIYDRVWLKNPTATDFITFTPEKGAEARTNYGKFLEGVPTTKDELPKMKLVNGERYEYHFPENPTYGDGSTATRGGWVRQDYPAGLIEPPKPIIPPALEESLFSGKTKTFATKVPVHYYFGKKRGVIEFIFEFARNEKYGMISPECPAPSSTPSALPGN